MKRVVGIAGGERDVAARVGERRRGRGPRSQFVVGSQPGAVVGVPSHCSMNTFASGVKPVAETVNGCGLPAASPGTANGFPVGVVIVDAKAAEGDSTSAAPPQSTAKSKATIRRTAFPPDWNYVE